MENSGEMEEILVNRRGGKGRKEIREKGLSDTSCGSQRKTVSPASRRTGGTGSFINISSMEERERKKNRREKKQPRGG